MCERTLSIGFQATTYEDKKFDASELSVHLAELSDSSINFTVLPIEEETVYPKACIDIFSSDQQISIAEKLKDFYLDEDYTLKPFLYDVRNIFSNLISAQVVFRTAPWIVFSFQNETASSDCVMYEKTLLQEIKWAIYCSSQTIVIPCYHMDIDGLIYLGSIIKRISTECPNIRFCFEFPVVSQINGNYVSTWEFWKELYSVAYNVNVGVILNLNAVNVSFTSREIARWLQEPVHAILLDDTTLKQILNSTEPEPLEQVPVDLNKKEAFKFLISKISLYRHMTCIYQAPYTQINTQLIRRFIELFQSKKLLESELSDIMWANYLQDPLQPLARNLGHQIYETFETDQTKYILYQEAIKKYMVSRIGSPLRVIVAGAGRGPLVDAVLQVCEEINMMDNVDITALEKNENAIITLKDRVKCEPKWAKVNIVENDMRTYMPDEKYNILVSELIGSFGDNELAPECLCAATHNLLKNDGLGIPQSFTSYVEPISNTKVWLQCLKKQSIGRGFESMHVVHLQDTLYISKSGPKPCFSFDYSQKNPNGIQQPNSIEYKKITFDILENCLCHGFAGYFVCQLFEEVVLSTRRDSQTEHLNSWYPIYIPLSQFIYLQANSFVTFHIWRRSNQKHVWYEWTVSTASGTLPIHNLNGKNQVIDKV